jgi:hypothetical protein
MRNNKKQSFIDGLARKKNIIREFDLPLARYVTKYKKTSVLFSATGRTESFFTSDSKLYFTPEESKRMEMGERIVRVIGRLDSLNSGIFEKTRTYPGAVPDSFLSLKIKKLYIEARSYALQLGQDSKNKITVIRMWNLSIVGAVIFGMLTMTMIYRYLGQGVSAAIEEKNQAVQTQALKEAMQAEIEAKEALAAKISQETNDQIDMDSITSLLGAQNEQADLEKQIIDMVKGYPIEEMAPLIAKQERVVAAFLIGIARQESSWGVHVPVYQGQDCYNLWGWRGKNAVGTGGHTCFASPEEAVETVAKRIKFLVSNQKLNTPEKMIIWKCGDCSWDNQRDMQRWISSVSTYFHKLNTD